MERFLDVVLSGIAIVILSPILAIVMIGLRCTGEGEIFFKQERIGKNGKIFNLIKFATMLKNSPSIGTGTITVSNDPRILPFGKYLRKSKVNELPQLLNIFFGDMSIVGPRPLTHQTFSAYPDTTQLEIKRVRPGLSGIGSIVFRNEENILNGSENNINFYEQIIAPYKGELEIWYVKNMSFMIYIMVIFITLWVVLVPSSRIIWHIFKSLPKPPDQLERLL